MSEREIHRKYLRGIPPPRPLNRAKIDEAVAATRAKTDFARNKDVSFEELHLVCRDGLVHKGQIPSMERIVALLDKVSSDEEFDKTIVVLKHLQRQLWDFLPSVANAFIRAGLRIEQEDKVVKALHRSVLDRNQTDEEPFYRMFPQPTAYVQLVSRLRAKGDLASALRVFSIAAAQFRDNPDSNSNWNRLYLIGMDIYMEKKRYDQVIKLHREARYLNLPELPAMLIRRLRIEAMAEQPRIDWMIHMRSRILFCGQHSKNKRSLEWAEATALIIYADNNTNFKEVLGHKFLLGVPRHLSTFLDPERVRTIWPLTEEEEQVDLEAFFRQRREENLAKRVQQLKNTNPFFAHYPPNLILMILTRFQSQKQSISSPTFPKSTPLPIQLRGIEVTETQD